MKSARSKLFLFSFLLLGTLVASQVCQAEEGASTAPCSRELEGIKSQLAALDQQEKQILANQQETFQRLDQLRIWVHRK